MIAGSKGGESAIEVAARSQPAPYLAIVRSPLQYVHGSSPQPIQPVSGPSWQLGVPLRVLHVHSGNIYGGIERLLCTLAQKRFQSGNCHQEFALCFSGQLSEELSHYGVLAHDIGNVRFRSPLSVMRARSRLSELLASGRYDIAVCHSPWSYALFSATLCKHDVPCVLWFHAPPTGRHWLEKLARRRRPAVMIANSEYTRVAAAAFFSTVACERIYPAVPPSSPFASPGERARFRRALGAGDDDVIIAQVGRIEDGKGLTTHIDALVAMTQNPSWQLWVVGGAQRPKEVTYLRDLIDAIATKGLGGRVRFLGQRTDIDHVLQAADIYCQPNRSPEGFGITFVEALYAGCPVITTRMGGAEEILDHSCGILVEPNDVAALATALDALVCDRMTRRRLGAAGPARAAQLSDPHKRVAQFEAVCHAASCQGVHVTAKTHYNN